MKDIDATTTIQVRCLTGVDAAFTHWQTTNSPAYTRPRTGEMSIPLKCDRCGERFTILLDSIAKAKRKQILYTTVGSVLTALLVVLVPTFFSLAGQVNDEGVARPEQFWSLEWVFPLIAFCLIVGPSFIYAGRNYAGIRKFRRINKHGKPTALTAGHKYV